MKSILLDTNFLMAISQNGIDITSELERICDFTFKLFIVDKTIDELKKITQQKKHKTWAKFALSLIERLKINVIKTNTDDYVDDIIVSLNDEYITATQDKDLKKRLKGPIIIIRQKKYLKIEGN